MNTSFPNHAWSELALRENDGLAVSLHWNRATGRVKVAVDDAQLGDHFEINVHAADALAAFHHPFAYAAELGASFGDAGSRAPERSTV
jgi:hypothetical protein